MNSNINNFSLFLYFKKCAQNIDWLLVSFLLPILAAGLVTMNSFAESGADFFSKQLFWILISFVIFFLLSGVDFRFLKKTQILVFLFLLISLFLLVTLALGGDIKGSSRWLSFGGFTFQPSEFMKIILILILAKYFSRRHVEIANIKHILISGVYGLVPFLLVFFQPDLGSSIIIFAIWFGMTVVSGISKKHLAIVFSVGLVSLSFLWIFVLQPYQKSRITNFLNPYTNVQGSGYNAYQSMIAVGSGQIMGKGVGYGTQSRFQFLPEHETDFIFAAFAEEWGFVGVMILLLFFCLVIWRILVNTLAGSTNFEILFGLGVVIFFMTHIIINIGMNIGILPVTGITLPFMSYGGSHLLTEFTALGILMGMRGYRRIAHRDDMKNEFLGV